MTAGTFVLVGVGGIGGAVGSALVTSSQIKDNTILSRDVRDGSLKQKDLQPPAVAVFRGLNGYEIIRGSYPVLDASLDWAPSGYNIYCPPDSASADVQAGPQKSVVSGSYYLTGPAAYPAAYNVTYVDIDPPGEYGDGTKYGGRYTVNVQNLSSPSRQLTLHLTVVCADVDPSSVTVRDLGPHDTE